MKKYCLAFILLFVSILSLAQSKEDFIGKWKLTYSYRVYLGKFDIDWDQILTINDDGSFDFQLGDKSYSYVGSWILTDDYELKITNESIKGKQSKYEWFIIKNGKLYEYAYQVDDFGKIKYDSDDGNTSIYSKIY